MYWIKFGCNIFLNNASRALFLLFITVQSIEARQPPSPSLLIDFAGEVDELTALHKNERKVRPRKSNLCKNDRFGVTVPSPRSLSLDEG